MADPPGIPSGFTADGRVHRHDQYADRTNLDARSSIYEFRAPALDFPNWALDLAALESPHRILDVGCGPGTYVSLLGARFPAAAVIGGDISIGMARHARVHGPTLALDASHLPFPEASFDAALAMHMLYHVADPIEGVAELRRVLRNDGLLLAATNGEGHLGGFDRVVVEATGLLDQWVRSKELFSLENGAGILRTAFPFVARHSEVGELILPTPEPAMAYVESVRSFLEPQLDVPWERATAAIEEVIRSEIAADGAFRSTVHAGVFVASAKPRSKMATDVGVQVDPSNVESVLADLSRRRTD